jgi:hypothetical protein
MSFAGGIDSVAVLNQMQAAQCGSTEVAWAGAPRFFAPVEASRVRPSAVIYTPKDLVDFSYVGAQNAWTQYAPGYQQIHDTVDMAGQGYGDLLRGAYDRTSYSRPNPGCLRLGISADASWEGAPQMRGYTPRPTQKDERADSTMRPLGMHGLDADSENGYRLGWRVSTYRRQDKVIQELDPAVQLDNLRANPLAGPLPVVQHTDVRFQTGCDTIGFCPQAQRFC